MAESRTVSVNMMMSGRWVPIGEAEILVDEGNRIQKVVSFTPIDFPIPEEDVLKVPSVRVDPKDVPRFDQKL